MSADEVQLLVKQFIQLRQAGYGRNDAWFELEETARGLPVSDQKRLTSLLQQWEKQVVTNSKPITKPIDDPYDTINDLPDGWEQARQYAAEERRRHVIRRLEPIEGQGTDEINAAGNGHPVGNEMPCPKCQRMNPVKSAYCYSCGMPMDAATTVNSTRPLVGAEVDAAFFDEHMILFLKVQGSDGRLQVEPGMVETILGRTTADSVMIPDVDLSPFQAGEYGVSRLHASLRRQSNTVVMTDLGSKNHTHINGQRLHAHEVRVLHDGDEIRLGRLVLYVYFAPK